MLTTTQNDYSLAFARIVLGVVFFAHGAQKMLGWFGGAGFSRITSGPLFRPVNRHGRVAHRALHKDSVGAVLKPLPSAPA